jgi:hypothetical protein
MLTTLNNDINLFGMISIYSSRKGISRSKLIIMLLKQSMKEVSVNKIGIAVRYQHRRPRDSWKVFPIRLNDCDYEFFLDLRKVLKFSVSRILAHAIEKYLGKNSCLCR